MVEAVDDDIPPGWEWISLFAYVERTVEVLVPKGLRKLPDSSQHALSVICHEFEERKVRVCYDDADDCPCPAGEFRYRKSDGNIYQTRLPGFWLRAEFDSAMESATWTKVERIPNPFYPMARADCLTPQATWLDDPRSRFEYIEEKTIVMARNIQVLVPCTEEKPVVEPAELAGAAPAAEPPKPVKAAAESNPSKKKKRSRRKTIYHAAQRGRAKVVLRRKWPDGNYPCRDELPDSDLYDQFCAEYDRVEGKAREAAIAAGKKPPSKYGRPSKDTVLREVGPRD
jgi:hypothetical protein